MSGITDDQRSAVGSMLDRMDNMMEQIPEVESAFDNDSGGESAAKFSPFGQPDISFEDVAVATITPRSSWEITFPQALQWALIGCAAAFAMSIVSERTRGTFLRLRLAPITRGHVLAGKGLACFITCVLVCALLMMIGIFVLGVQVASYPWLIVAILASSACFVGMMMLVSVLGRTEQAVAGFSWGLFLVCAMFGGGMVPLMMMPEWMFALGSFSPVKWSVLATEGAIWRGFGMADMLQPVGILLGIGAISYTAGVLILRQTDR